MKTTLEIDDALYREVKAMAALTGRKMKDLVSEGLERVLREGNVERPKAVAQAMKLPLLPSSQEKGRVTSDQVYELETSADADRW